MALAPHLAPIPQGLDLQAAGIPQALTPLAAAQLPTGVIQLVFLLIILAVVHIPLGRYIATVVEGKKHLGVERAIYKFSGINAGDKQGQKWSTYALSVLGFSMAGLILLYVMQRIQGLWSDMPGVTPALAWNTAASFVGNTNWQSYSGEQTMGAVVQMVGLAVQNFVSAAVGIAIAIALIRGFTRTLTDRLGNFWVDLTRITLRLLLPIAVIGALLLLAAGVIQNFNAPEAMNTLSGSAQNLPGGPVASQEVIKTLGTNGGGFFNANSAHPFENPNGFSNLLEIVLILLIPSALPRTFGILVGDTRQGWAIVGVMMGLFLVIVVLVSLAEASNQGVATAAAGAAMEGKEQRFGIFSSALFGSAATGTSTGAVNSFHSSFTPFGGGMVLLAMMLGEIAPGGVGSGLYGILIIAMIAVFLAGLMVGRTPEYLGKKLRPKEVSMAAAYILATPFAVLIGTGIAFLLPSTRDAMLSTGPHGLTEVLYAFTSAGNNNGSAFGGLSANTTFFNTALGLAILIGRFLPIVLVLALAGSLAKQRHVPATAGTLPTHRPLFVTLLTATIVIVVALTYFPVLALGPLAEGLS